MIASFSVALNYSQSCLYQLHIFAPSLVAIRCQVLKADFSLDCISSVIAMDLHACAISTPILHPLQFARYH